MKKIAFLSSVVIGFTVSFSVLTVLSKNSSEKTDIKRGRVVFVTGSCSSGKSSLARVIAQKLKAKSYAFDEYVIPILARKMVEKEVGKPLAFFITRVLPFNFFTLVGFLSEKRKYEYQLKFYAELKNGFAIAPTKKMYEQVRKNVLAGRNVVVEAPLHLGDGVDCTESLSVLKDLDVSFVLAYCPWRNLVERIAARNQSPNKKIHRELDWALGNYLHYFDITPNYHKKSIDKVSGKSVKRLLSLYSRPTFKKKRMQILPETAQAARECFKTNKLYYLRPHLAYDLIINTQTHKPEQGATQVVDFVQNKSNNKPGFQQIAWTR